MRKKKEPCCLRRKLLRFDSTGSFLIANKKICLVCYFDGFFRVLAFAYCVGDCPVKSLNFLEK